MEGDGAGGMDGLWIGEDSGFQCDCAGVRGVRGENGEGGIERKEGLKGTAEIRRLFWTRRSGMLNGKLKTLERCVLSDKPLSKIVCYVRSRLRMCIKLWGAAVIKIQVEKSWRRKEDWKYLRHSICSDSYLNISRAVEHMPELCVAIWFKAFFVECSARN